MNWDDAKKLMEQPIFMYLIREGIDFQLESHLHILKGTTPETHPHLWVLQNQVGLLSVLETVFGGPLTKADEEQFINELKKMKEESK